MYKNNNDKDLMIKHFRIIRNDHLYSKQTRAQHVSSDGWVEEEKEDVSRNEGIGFVS